MLRSRKSAYPKSLSTCKKASCLRKAISLKKLKLKLFPSFQCSQAERPICKPLSTRSDAIASVRTIHLLQTQTEAIIKRHHPCHPLKPLDTSKTAFLLLAQDPTPQMEQLVAIVLLNHSMPKHLPNQIRSTLPTTCSKPRAQKTHTTLPTKQGNSHLKTT